MSEAANYQVIYEGRPSCCGSYSQWCMHYKWLITDEFIEYESGICCKSIENLQLIRVKDIQYRNSCCCSCCGVITILSSDQTTPELHVKGLDNSRKIYQQIRNAFLNKTGKARLELGT